MDVKIKSLCIESINFKWLTLITVSYFQNSYELKIRHLSATLKYCFWLAMSIILGFLFITCIFLVVE